MTHGYMFMKSCSRRHLNPFEITNATMLDFGRENVHKYTK